MTDPLLVLVEPDNGQLQVTTETNGNIKPKGFQSWWMLCLLLFVVVLGLLALVIYLCYKSNCFDRFSAPARRRDPSAPVHLPSAPVHLPLELIRQRSHSPFRDCIKDASCADVETGTGDSEPLNSPDRSIGN